MVHCHRLDHEDEGMMGLEFVHDGECQCDSLWSHMEWSGEAFGNGWEGFSESQEVTTEKPTTVEPITEPTTREPTTREPTTSETAEVTTTEQGFLAGWDAGSAEPAADFSWFFRWFSTPAKKPANQKK